MECRLVSWRAEGGARGVGWRVEGRRDGGIEGRDELAGRGGAAWFVVGG